MKEFVISEVKAETAILVGLITQQQDEAKTKEYLDELEFLAETAPKPRCLFAEFLLVVRYRTLVFIQCV